MNGEALVSHLRALEVPGTESLDGAHYDWLFQAKDTAPLASFLEWFTKNITAQDLLTDAELDEYDALKERGEVVMGQQLEDMESFLSSVPSTHTLSHHHTHPPLSQEEQYRLQDQLQLLNKRKNHLSIHKMGLQEEVSQCNKQKEAAEVELRRQQEGLLLTSHHHNKVQEDFTKSLDSFIDSFHIFEKTPAEEARYVSQLGVEEWHQEEIKFTHTLKTYLRKQFTEGVRMLAGEEDRVEYYLLEPGNLDLYLVRGEGQAEYTHNVQELNRITKLLCETEEWRVEGLVLQARRKAEIEEADRLLAAIQTNQLPSTLTLLKQQLEETQAAATGVRQEREEQRRVVAGLVGEVAQLEATTTISGNYQLKFQRQTYFLAKQNIVLEQLVSQVGRYNWVTIALNMERESIKDILQLLHTFNTIMAERSNDCKERMTRLEAMTKDIEERKASNQLPLPLQTLSQLLSSPSKPQDGDKDGASGKTLKIQMDTLQKTLNVARQLVSTAKNPQFSRLDKMTSLCEALETCLFGHPGSLQSLPLAWLEQDLAHRCHALDNQAWKFKYKLLDLLRQHDEKKKILQVDPTAREDVEKWTCKLLKSLE